MNVFSFLARCFTEGKDPNTDQTAAKISTLFDKAYKLALEKRAAAQKGKNDVEGIRLNVESVLTFLVLFAKNDATQAVPLIQYTIQGIEDGFKKRGLLGASGEGTTGFAYGIVNGFGQIDKDSMKLDKVNLKDIENLDQAVTDLLNKLKTLLKNLIN